MTHTAYATPDFSDLEDLSDLEGTSYTPPAVPQNGTFFDAMVTAVHNTAIKITCRACNGTGFWGWARRPCFKCNSTGKLNAPKALKMDTASVERRAQYKQDKVADEQARVATIAKYRVDNAPVFQWLDTHSKYGNPFAQSLLAYFNTNAYLTQGHITAVERNIAKVQTRKAEIQATVICAAGAGFDKLIQAFKTARENKLKYPKIRIANLIFSYAPDAGKNPGFLYVNDSKQTTVDAYSGRDKKVYYGKISPRGEYFPDFKAPAEVKTLVEQIAANPLQAATAHGLKTGNCACCNRELTDPESIQRGIGPVCAEKFGW